MATPQLAHSTIIECNLCDYLTPSANIARPKLFLPTHPYHYPSSPYLPSLRVNTLRLHIIITQLPLALRLAINLLVLAKDIARSDIVSDGADDIR